MTPLLWKDYQKEVADNHYFFVRSCIRQTFFPGAEAALLTILRDDVGVGGVRGAQLHATEALVQVLDGELTIDNCDHDAAMARSQCTVDNDQVTIVDASFPH